MVTAAPKAAVARSRSRLGRCVTLAGLVHPFPSVLAGLVVTVVALVAGGSRPRASLLGISMVGLQFAIGALSELVDARKASPPRAGQPIAEGLLGEGTARLIGAGCAIVGLALALAAGLPLLGMAAGALAIGLWYAVWAKDSTLSWLPIALGGPLLPVYGWYGATGSLPSAFAVLVPAAVLAGAALAIANAAVDVERDVAGAPTSLPVALGPRALAATVLLLETVVAVVAVLSSGGSGRSGPWLGATVATAALPVAGALLGFLGAHRHAVREVAFEVQAVGLGLLAVAWVNALSVAAA